MLQNESILLVGDNSGAKEILIIRLLGGSNRKYSYVGDIVVATVKKANPNSNVKKGQIVRAVIVASKYPYRRSDTSICFSGNWAIIINDKLEPVGTRIFTPILAEFSKWNFSKIFSLAPQII